MQQETAKQMLVPAAREIISDMSAQGVALPSLVIGSLLAILTVDVTGHVTRPTPSFAAMFVFSRPRIGVGGWDAGGIS